MIRPRLVLPSVSVKKNICFGTSPVETRGGRHGVMSSEKVVLFATWQAGRRLLASGPSRGAKIETIREGYQGGEPLCLDNEVHHFLLSLRMLRLGDSTTG